MSQLVPEDVPVLRRREPSTLVRPEGALTFDWVMVLAVRRQIDQPDPRWLERLGQITAETLVLADGPYSHVPQDGVAELAGRVPGRRVVTIPVGHLIHHAPPAFIEAVSAFLGRQRARTDVNFHEGLVPAHNGIGLGKPNLTGFLSRSRPR